MKKSITDKLTGLLYYGVVIFVFLASIVPIVACAIFWLLPSFVVDYLESQKAFERRFGLDSVEKSAAIRKDVRDYAFSHAQLRVAKQFVRLVNTIAAPCASVAILVIICELCGARPFYFF